MHVGALLVGGHGYPSVGLRCIQSTAGAADPRADSTRLTARQALFERDRPLSRSDLED